MSNCSQMWKVIYKYLTVVYTHQKSLCFCSTWLKWTKLRPKKVWTFFRTWSNITMHNASKLSSVFNKWIINSSLWNNFNRDVLPQHANSQWFLTKQWAKINSVSVIFGLSAHQQSHVLLIWVYLLCSPGPC